MALPILDGNQSATTLSTILSSGQHITAHTVVSLGTQAITDISGAVSGSVISISNLPATQPVSISSVTIGNTVTISGTVTANPTGTQTIAGTVTANLANVVTTDLYSVSSAVKVTGADGQGVLLGGLNSIGNPENVYEGGAIPVRGSVAMDVPISGTVTVGNSVTIASLPAISGTVTANLTISSTVITSGSFSSLTSATLVPANPARKMATVYNLGAGQLFVNAGATATTLGGGFMVALSSGDFYECNYTTTTLSAIFATAGTASWVSN